MLSEKGKLMADQNFMGQKQSRIDKFRSCYPQRLPLQIDYETQK